VHVERPGDVAKRCHAHGAPASVRGCWYVEGGQDVVVVPHPEHAPPEGAFWVLLHEIKHVMEGQFHE
jgi:hypothetical protein